MGMKIGLILAFIIIAPLIGGLLEGFDRVITARMQGRQGPPLLQPFYDLYKLLNKQSVVVNNVQDILVCGFLIFVIFAGAPVFLGRRLAADFLCAYAGGDFLHYVVLFGQFSLQFYGSSAGTGPDDGL